MNFSDDLLNDQVPLPFSPSWFPPSPEPFQMMEFPENPTMVGTDDERVDEESGGSEVNPSTTQHNPHDIVQEHLFSNSDGLQRSEQDELLNSSLQEPTVSFMQQPEYQQQRDYSNPALQLTSSQYPEVSLMDQLLANSDAYQQASDQQDSSNPNLMKSIEEIDAFLQDDDNSGRNGHHGGQQDPLDPSFLNYFQEGDESLMIDISQIMGEEYNGLAQQPLNGSSELPNHPQEQLLPVPLSQSYPSYPTYQHGPAASHLNRHGQQAPPPLVVANIEDQPLAPRMVTDVARTYPQQSQVSTTTPPPLMPSSSTSHLGNVQELENDQPPPRFRFREIRPRPTPFIPPPFIPPPFIPPPFIPPQQTIALGRRQRRRQNPVERGESSSAQPRLILPRITVDPNAPGLPQERLQNYLYSPNYESLGIPIDPHLRNFAPRRRRR